MPEIDKNNKPEEVVDIKSATSSEVVKKIIDSALQEETTAGQTTIQIMRNKIVASENTVVIDAQDWQALYKMIQAMQIEMRDPDDVDTEKTANIMQNVCGILGVDINFTEDGTKEMIDFSEYEGEEVDVKFYPDTEVKIGDDITADLLIFVNDCETKLGSSLKRIDKTFYTHLMKLSSSKLDNINKLDNYISLLVKIQNYDIEIDDETRQNIKDLTDALNSEIRKHVSKSNKFYKKKFNKIENREVLVMAGKREKGTLKRTGRKLRIKSAKATSEVYDGSGLVCELNKDGSVNEEKVEKIKSRAARLAAKNKKKKDKSDDEEEDEDKPKKKKKKKKSDDDDEDEDKPKKKKKKRKSKSDDEDDDDEDDTESMKKKKQKNKDRKLKNMCKSDKKKKNKSDDDDEDEDRPKKKKKKKKSKSKDKDESDEKGDKGMKMKYIDSDAEDIKDILEEILEDNKKEIKKIHKNLIKDIEAVIEELDEEEEGSISKALSLLFILMNSISLDKKTKKAIIEIVSLGDDEDEDDDDEEEDKPKKKKKKKRKSKSDDEDDDEDDEDETPSEKRRRLKKEKKKKRKSKSDDDDDEDEETTKKSGGKKMAKLVKGLKKIGKEFKSDLKDEDMYDDFMELMDKAEDGKLKSKTIKKFIEAVSEESTKLGKKIKKSINKLVDKDDAEEVDADEVADILGDLISDFKTELKKADLLKSAKKLKSSAEDDDMDSEDLADFVDEANENNKLKKAAKKLLKKLTKLADSDDEDDDDDEPKRKKKKGGKNKKNKKNKKKIDWDEVEPSKKEIKELKELIDESDLEKKNKKSALKMIKNEEWEDIYDLAEENDDDLFDELKDFFRGLARIIGSSAEDYFIDGTEIESVKFKDIEDTFDEDECPDIDRDLLAVDYEPSSDELDVPLIVFGGGAEKRQDARFK